MIYIAFLLFLGLLFLFSVFIAPGYVFYRHLSGPSSEEENTRSTRLIWSAAMLIFWPAANYFYAFLSKASGRQTKLVALFGVIALVILTAAFVMLAIVILREGRLQELKQMMGSSIG